MKVVYRKLDRDTLCVFRLGLDIYDDHGNIVFSNPKEKEIYDEIRKDLINHYPPEKYKIVGRNFYMKDLDIAFMFRLRYDEHINLIEINTEYGKSYDPENHSSIGNEDEL